MQLSKQESKYRSKLFYENGYRKSQQQDLDYFVKTHNATYKDVYFKSPLQTLFTRLGLVIKNEDDTCKWSYVEVLDKISDKWNT